MTKLKPCPFCGCLAWAHQNQTVFANQKYEGEEGDIGYRIECEGDCHAMTCWWHTPKQAIQAWNTRATPQGTIITKDESTCPKGKHVYCPPTHISNNRGPWAKLCTSERNGKAYRGCIWWPADQFKAPKENNHG